VQKRRQEADTRSLQYSMARYKCDQQFANIHLQFLCAPACFCKENSQFSVAVIISRSFLREQFALSTICDGAFDCAHKNSFGASFVIVIGDGLRNCVQWDLFFIVECVEKQKAQ